MTTVDHQVDVRCAFSADLAACHGAGTGGRHPAVHSCWSVPGASEQQVQQQQLGWPGEVWRGQSWPRTCQADPAWQSTGLLLLNTCKQFCVRLYFSLSHTQLLLRSSCPTTLVHSTWWQYACATRGVLAPTALVAPNKRKRCDLGIVPVLLSATLRVASMACLSYGFGCWEWWA